VITLIAEREAKEQKNKKRNVRLLFELYGIKSKRSSKLVGYLLIARKGIVSKQIKEFS
jgi:hypothetical protein